MLKKEHSQSKTELLLINTQSDRRKKKKNPTEELNDKFEEISQSRTKETEMRMWSNWNSQTLLVGMENGISTLKKTVWQFLTKLTIHLTHDPTVSLLAVHTREMKTYIHIKTCT